VLSVEFVLEHSVIGALGFWGRCSFVAFGCMMAQHKVKFFFLEDENKSGVQVEIYWTRTFIKAELN
jgi:hypothetical protein